MPRERRVNGPTIFVALLALALSGCVRHGAPAPVTSAVGTGVRPAPAPGQIGLAEHPDSIVVQPGETLYAVSRRYAVPLRSLIEANNLQPPFALVAGRRLVLPQVRTYTVQPGDTLLGLSRRFGVEASTLARTNEIAPPYPVKLGQTLILPPPVQTAAAPAAPLPVVAATRGSPGSPSAVVAEPLAAPPQSDRQPASPPAPPSGRAPVMQEASRQPPAIVPEPGQPPRVQPQPNQSQPGQSQPAPAAPVASLPPVVPSPQPAPPTASHAPDEPMAPLPEPPHTGRGFAWPVRGPVLAGYGPGANGTQNDGINIAAPAGTPVLAANDGIVAYAGNELRGFGNLILLKHADGWTTAYAHCETITVKRGDRVKRGQTIARVGATGAVAEPQLHFELRRGTRALDPQSYLPPVSTASAG